VTAAPALPVPLRLKGIHKHFGGVVAVERFDLEVAAGEIVALVGDNGAGRW
jgi:simple sugar transport system ATP-binding protein